MNVIKVMQGFVIALILAASAPALAQDTSTPELRRNIDLFTGILEEALDLDERVGLFGLAQGEVKGTYLQAQGVLFQIRTPLSSRRNNLSLASINTRLQSLPRSNPFAMASRAPAPAQLDADAAAGEAGSYYQQMMARISSVDYSLLINGAIQQAADAARSLRALGSLDEEGYVALREELDGMREELQARMNSLRELQNGESPNAPDASDSASSVLENLSASIDALQERAAAKAAELQQRNEQAEQAYAQSWANQVATLEQTLYATMCDFASSLRGLPEGERVSVILEGLGSLDEGDQRPDKVHVFSRSDLLECQAGTISKDTLAQRSNSYSF